MYCLWKELDFWPSRELVDTYQVVLSDSMLTPGGAHQNPGKAIAQQVTYSTYENRNTLNVLVGITPGGLA